MRIKIKFVSAFFLLFFAFSFCSYGADEKKFEDFNCKLSLPGKGWKWADGNPAGSLCAAVEPSEKLIFSLSASKAQENMKIDDDFSDSFEQGFFKDGVVENKESSLKRWKNTICYEARAYFKTVDRMALIRIFVADGIFYRLDIIGPPAFFEKAPGPAQIFSKFEFIKASDGKPMDRNGLALSVCIIAVFILFALKMMFFKAKGGNANDGGTEKK